MHISPGQRASRDVRGVARVLHVAPSHVVVEVGLWDLLPGVHRHLTRQNPVRVTDHTQTEIIFKSRKITNSALSFLLF